MKLANESAFGLENKKLKRVSVDSYPSYTNMMKGVSNTRTFVIKYLDLCKWTPAGRMRTGSVGVKT